MVWGLLEEFWEIEFAESEALWVVNHVEYIDDVDVFEVADVHSGVFEVIFLVADRF